MTLRQQEAAAWASYKAYVRLRMKQTPGGNQIPRPDAEMHRRHAAWQTLWRATRWH